jgi:hypothetical protein
MYASVYTRMSVDQPEMPIRVDHIADAALTQHTQENVRPTPANTTAVSAGAFVPPSIDLDVDSLIS